MPGKLELAGAVPYEVTERALATHAQKLKETGADTLILYPTMTHGALILKEMTKIGYKPKVLVTFTLGDPIMFNLAGADVWEGVLSRLSGQLGSTRRTGRGQGDRDPEEIRSQTGRARNTWPFSVPSP